MLSCKWKRRWGGGDNNFLNANNALTFRIVFVHGLEPYPYVAKGSLESRCLRRQNSKKKGIRLFQRGEIRKPWNIIPPPSHSTTPTTSSSPTAAPPTANYSNTKKPSKMPTSASSSTPPGAK